MFFGPDSEADWREWLAGERRRSTDSGASSSSARTTATAERRHHGGRPCWSALAAVPAPPAPALAGFAPGPGRRQAARAASVPVPLAGLTDAPRLGVAAAAGAARSLLTQQLRRGGSGQAPPALHQSISTPLESHVGWVGSPQGAARAADAQPSSSQRWPPSGLHSSCGMGPGGVPECDTLALGPPAGGTAACRPPPASAFAGQSQAAAGFSLARAGAVDTQKPRIARAGTWPKPVPQSAAAGHSELSRSQVRQLLGRAVLCGGAVCRGS